VLCHRIWRASSSAQRGLDKRAAVE
jgi:hypothetical protein